MTTRDFHIGDILSITTGQLVSPRQMDGIYDILNFMQDDKLFSHQLPRASKDCKPYLLEQHPQLAAVNGEEITEENWEGWLAEQVARFGETLPLLPVPPAQRHIRPPLEELKVMMPDKQIIPIIVDDEA
jgi:hypothetical protein